MLSDYTLKNDFIDEVFFGQNAPHGFYDDLLTYFKTKTKPDFIDLNNAIKERFVQQGVTYKFWKDGQVFDQTFPFDVFPRLIAQAEWQQIEVGLFQRQKALNAFISDVYNKAEILKEGLVPAPWVFESTYFCKQMMGFTPPNGVYVHIAGTDLVRHKDGQFYVLEDNLRCPSGVSYQLTGRRIMHEFWTENKTLQQTIKTEQYLTELKQLFVSMAPKQQANPKVVVLTSGKFNSAYYEHQFLSQNIDIQLVEGWQLFVDCNEVFVRTQTGREKVDVIYRRIDDDFLDPMVFNPDSLLGVAGLMQAYISGNVAICNAPGAGIADDKAIYTFVPQMIEFYLNEKPILPNVPTYRCQLEDEMDFVLRNMEKLVVKPVDASGGKGVMVGSSASEEEMDDYKQKIKENPSGFIAQPIICLSTHPTFIEDEIDFKPRHIDLRTFSLLGANNSAYALAGGLTRVALREGSLIVNSSQGGGSKDTWVV